MIQHGSRIMMVLPRWSYTDEEILGYLEVIWLGLFCVRSDNGEVWKCPTIFSTEGLVHDRLKLFTYKPRWNTK